MPNVARAARACVPLAAIAVLSGSLAARPSEHTPAALAIIVNRGNPVDDLTMGQLRRIFMLDTQTWPNGRKITVVLREKGQPERDDAIQLVCGMSGAEYDRHILVQTFRGSIGWGPRSILSATAMLRFVFNVPGAIGYVGPDEADETTKVLRVDGLAPSDPRYPLWRGTRAN